MILKVSELPHVKPKDFRTTNACVYFKHQISKPIPDDQLPEHFLKQALLSTCDYLKDVQTMVLFYVDLCIVKAWYTRNEYKFDLVRVLLSFSNSKVKGVNMRLKIKAILEEVKADDSAYNTEHDFLKNFKDIWSEN